MTYLYVKLKYIETNWGEAWFSKAVFPVQYTQYRTFTEYVGYTIG